MALFLPGTINASSSDQFDDVSHRLQEIPAMSSRVSEMLQGLRSRLDSVSSLRKPFCSLRIRSWIARRIVRRNSDDWVSLVILFLIIFGRDLWWRRMIYRKEFCLGSYFFFRVQSHIGVHYYVPCIDYQKILSRIRRERRVPWDPILSVKGSVKVFAKHMKVWNDIVVYVQYSHYRSSLMTLLSLIYSMKILRFCAIAIEI